MSSKHEWGELLREKKVEGIILGSNSSGFEKTEEYWSAKILHISGGLVMSLLSIFRGPIDPFVICFFLANE